VFLVPDGSGGDSVFYCSVPKDSKINIKEVHQVMKAYPGELVLTK
jgi:hypothetical protein